MRRRMRIAALLLAMTLLVLLPVTAAAESETQANRYNMMLVLDASVSMNSTDPYGFRYEAMNLFANLLADQGNTLGGVVFSTDIDREIAPKLRNGQEEKDAVVDAMRNVLTPGGWTNIGRGLEAAVDGLKKNGDPDLPSAIILLSDGGTAMFSEEQTRDSVERRDAAVKNAAENGISIYSVCLNVNGAAETAEMKQISADTGGIFTEVRSPEDLNAALKAFYGRISGTASQTVADEVIPSEGVLETPFEIPGFGVEEVNILVEGNATELSLIRPDGSEYEEEVSVYQTFSSVKLTDIVPGTWKLRSKGISGDEIRIEILYNSNLEVLLYLNGEGELFDPTEPVTLTAVLSAGTEKAVRYEDYEGFSAELTILNERGEDLQTLPMTIGSSGFEATTLMDEGIYYFAATVTGNSLTRQSELLGPISFYAQDDVWEEVVQETEEEPVLEPEPEPEPNTAPTAKTGQSGKLVMIWPFVQSRASIDLNTLVTDKEDGVLQFESISSDFREGTEYRITPAGQLILTPELLRTKGGSFTVRAIDSGGLSCEAGINVRIVNMVIVISAILILLLLAGLIALLKRRGQKKAFYGTLTVTTQVDGVTRTGTPRTPGKKGKYYLSAFDGIDPVGLDGNRCYFESGGESFVTLVTDRKVRWRGYETTTVRIDIGTETTVIVDDDMDRKLSIRYTADGLDLRDS